MGSHTDATLPTAGKGRSGTMACAYLLSLDHSLMPPRLERSYSVKQWAKRRMETAVDSLPHDDTLSPPHSAATLSPFLAKYPSSDTDGILDVDSGAVLPRLPTPNREKSFTDALKGVLDLHTARRMKPPSEKDREVKVKQGVSIPSQRRFLYYWTLFLAHEAPKHMWAVDTSGSVFQRSKEPSPKVRLTKLTLRMHETSTVKMGIVRVANKVLEKTNMAKGPVADAPSGSSLDSSNRVSSSSRVWASLARYDDTLVDLLQQWEVCTRDSGGHMGKRRIASEHLTPEGSTKEEEISRIFENGNQDKEKMVRRFAQLGVISKSDAKSVDGNVRVSSPNSQHNSSLTGSLFSTGREN
jgi:phosphatidylinositol-3,4,5-trisphosphate 3-phosphatase/dual-specificity protein phosphatase PTEN